MPARSDQTLLPAIESQACPCCKQVFASGQEKIKHQNDVGHFRCILCQRQFRDARSVIEHQLRHHKTVQEITCPGCLVVYTTAGSWLDHVERNMCKGIFPGDLEVRRQQLHAFRAALGERATTNDFSFPYAMTDTWAEDVPGPAYDNFEPHGGTVVEQEYKEQHAFPRLPTDAYRAGDTKVLDLLSGDAKVPKQKVQNAWGSGKGLFPGKAAYNAVPPPQNYSPQQPGGQGFPSTREDTGPCIDPYDPRFNPAVFVNPILGKFKCPHLSCSTKTNTAHGLAKHLKGPIHRAEPEMCPTCRREFPGKAALLRHIETAYVRCFCRNTDSFREVLSHLTGGILDARLSIEDENGERREVSVDELRGDMTEIFVDENAAKALRTHKGNGSVGSGPGFWEGTELQRRGATQFRGW